MATAKKAKPRPKASDPDRALTPREEAFCHEYLVDLNQSQAVIRAGYAVTNPSVQANYLMKRPAVRARIDALIAARAKKVDAKAEDVIRRLLSIVNADARKLTSHHVGACRYCHGIKHEYQWRTPREWREACDAAAAKEKPAPESTGGFGYRLTAPPNPDCPECDGLGVPYTRFADTKSLGGDEAVLFEGVKETRNGLEFKMADKGKALERLADHLGIYNRQQADDVANAFTGMVEQLLRGGSKAPIRPDPDPGENGDS